MEEPKFKEDQYVITPVGKMIVDSIGFESIGKDGDWVFSYTLSFLKKSGFRHRHKNVRFFTEDRLKPLTD